MVQIRIGAREARERFADLLGRVHYGGETVIVERSGRPMVAMIPVEMDERLVAEREARFRVLERIGSSTGGGGAGRGGSRCGGEGRGPEAASPFPE